VRHSGTVPESVVLCDTPLEVYLQLGLFFLGTILYWSEMEVKNTLPGVSSSLQIQIKTGLMSFLKLHGSNSTALCSKNPQMSYNWLLYT
jgi:hypothetical protein